VSEQGDDKDGAVSLPEPDAEGKALLETCGSIRALKDAWEKLSPEQRKTLGAVKNACKDNILSAETEA